MFLPLLYGLRAARARVPARAGYEVRASARSAETETPESGKDKT
tara:strand:+ start:476 stop:607 length:132 start_codon:yes stop_codon:yes gene_type:complete